MSIRSIGDALIVNVLAWQPTTPHRVITPGYIVALLETSVSATSVCLYQYHRGARSSVSGSLHNSIY